MLRIKKKKKKPRAAFDYTRLNNNSIKRCDHYCKKKKKNYSDLLENKTPINSIPFCHSSFQHNLQGRFASRYSRDSSTNLKDSFSSFKSNTCLQLFYISIVLILSDINQIKLLILIPWNLTPLQFHLHLFFECLHAKKELK